MTQSQLTPPSSTILPPPRRMAARTAEKRERIVECAMRHFAEAGYQAARVEDIAGELGIAKGSVFQHFGSKQGLFLAAYRRAVGSLPGYLDAPPEVTDRGFFEIIRYWLERTRHLVREDWVPYRVTLLGNYGTDLSLKREINRFLVTEDPYGTRAFVELGIRRGELRTDIDFDMVVSMVDWLMERFQDALVTEELDPGLFRHQGDPSQRTKARVAQFMKLLRSAIGTQPAPRTAPA
ncbi:MAG TPA: TetR/AcrR family transcriptional regulator [Actinomycetota bacterium]|jgi:AcrR family transcriptional regulator